MMNYLGVYHSNYPRSTAGVCDSPCVAKGRMMLCAPEIASEEQQLAMAYGRIRNRAALARQLECPVNAASAYLVLMAYRKWGFEYPNRIEGPVMTCVMDAARDCMVLSRDRMGEQPVFYSFGAEGRVVFSDHPDSLLKTASAEPVVNRDGMCELFGLGPARTPGKTPLRDVNMLEPGCTLVGRGNAMETRRYYTLEAKEHLEDEVETVAHVRKLLDDVVDYIAPLKPGAMLSGGLDSTSLTAMLCARLDDVRTFSVDYVDNERDFKPNAFRPEMDAPYIDLAVEAFKTQHRTFVLEQAALADALEIAVSARGFPGMADVDSSLLLFAGKIAPHVQSVVSGECGDEVFGGYPWFRGAPAANIETFPWSGSIELRESILRPEIARKLHLRQYVSDTVKTAIAQTGIEASPEDREALLKQMQLMCFRFFMANLQERAVRMCGHYNLEVLTPLCDDRLVEYVFNVPWSMKFMGGLEKGLFRAAVKDLMPPKLNQRKKSPYPKTCSPIYTEIVRGLTMAMLTDKEAPILEYVDGEKLRAIAESPMDPAMAPWFGQLMAGPQMLAYIWQVNHWMRERNVTVTV